MNASAANCDYDFFSRNNFGEYYDACDSSCSASAASTSIGGSNKDYAGGTILDQARLDAIKANQPIYEQAAKEANIPWQMVAVIHLRETGLRKVNPDNGQGIYQDYKKINGPYPPGPVDDAGFLSQSIWAANFLKGKSSNPDLLASGDEAQVKDAFFGYNGRASIYTTQAKSLGFTEGYDGSPYVVNKIDAARDPDKNPTTWGQITSDGGSISYPANSDYGAFVVYASLAGIKTSSCSSDLSGTLNEKIVQIAQSELALWTAGTLKPGTDYQKYTYGTAGDWCAWFVSYVLKEAGHPVDTSTTPDWPSVSQFLNESQTIGFAVHLKGDGYKPKPGDFALYDDHSHINIVVGYDEQGQMLTIGGNQAGEPFTASKITQNVGYGSSATSYVEVK